MQIIDSMIINKRDKIEKTKKAMDIIVYSSSFVDIVIAILVGLSYFKIGNPKSFLPSAEIILSLSVVMTMVLGVLMIYLKHYESLLSRFFQVRNHVSYHISNFQRLLRFLSRIKLPKYRYRYKPR